eukprot:1155496-Pelagomonas_calceolata.AAC.4
MKETGKNNKGSESYPTSIEEKGQEKDMLAQRAVGFPRQRVRGKLVCVCWVFGIMRPQGTRVMLSVFTFDCNPVESG